MAELTLEEFQELSQGMHENYRTLTTDVDWLRNRWGQLDNVRPTLHLGTAQVERALAVVNDSLYRLGRTGIESFRVLNNEIRWFEDELDVTYDKVSELSKLLETLGLPGNSLIQVDVNHSFLCFQSPNGTKSDSSGTSSSSGGQDFELPFSEFIGVDEHGKVKNLEEQLVQYGSKFLSDYLEWSIPNEFGKDYDVIGKALSGAANGFMMSALTLNGPVIALSTAVGLLSGFIRGVGDENKKDSDRYKQIKRQEFEKNEAQQNQITQNSSSLALQRDNTRFALEQYMPQGQTADFDRVLTNVANTSPLNHDVLLSLTGVLANRGFSKQEIERVLQQAGIFGSHLGMNQTEATNLALRISELANHRPNEAFALNSNDILSDLPILKILEDYEVGLGQPLTREQVQEKLNKGVYTNSQILEALNTASDNSHLMTPNNSFKSVMENYNSIMQDIETSRGESYNETLKEYAKECNQKLLENGGRLKEINRLIGIAEASYEGEEMLAKVDAMVQMADDYEKSSYYVDLGDIQMQGEDRRRVQIQAGFYSKGQLGIAQTMGQINAQNGPAHKASELQKVSTIKAIGVFLSKNDNYKQLYGNSPSAENELSKGIVSQISAVDFPGEFDQLSEEEIAALVEYSLENARQVYGVANVDKERPEIVVSNDLSSRGILQVDDIRKGLPANPLKIAIDLAQNTAKAPLAPINVTMNNVFNGTDYNNREQSQQYAIQIAQDLVNAMKQSQEVCAS